MEFLSKVAYELSKHKYGAEYNVHKGNFKMVKIKTPSPRKKNNQSLKKKLEAHFKKMEIQANKNIAPGGRWYISPDNR
jgi:hypothetical protein